MRQPANRFAKQDSQILESENRTMLKLFLARNVFCSYQAVAQSKYRRGSSFDSPGWTAKEMLRLTHLGCPNPIFKGSTSFDKRNGQFEWTCEGRSVSALSILASGVSCTQSRADTNTIVFSSSCLTFKTLLPQNTDLILGVCLIDLFSLEKYRGDERKLYSPTLDIAPQGARTFFATTRKS